MAIKLHNLEEGELKPVAETMQSLFAAMRGDIAARKADSREMDYLPIVTDSNAEEGMENGDILEIRRQTLLQIIWAYMGSVRAVSGQKFRSKRLPKEISDIVITPELLAELVAHLDDDCEIPINEIVDAITSVVVEEDPQFGAAVTDKRYGLISLLGKIIDFVIDRKLPAKQMLDLLKSFSRAESMPFGRDAALYELPWMPENEGEKDGVIYRRDIIRRRIQSFDLRVSNDILISELLINWRDMELVKFVVEILQNALRRCDCNEYETAQWSNVCLKGLKNVKLTPHSAAVIKAFLIEMNGICKKASLAGLIDNLVQEKLPEIIKNQNPGSAADGAPDSKKIISSSAPA